MRNRGFTLIEVMVGAAVAILVIGVVMGTFLSQQRAMQTLDLSREASNATRDAMLSMQETIGRAGYGIDPRYAFDLRQYNCTNYTGATTATNACRDKIDAPDELVFVERDPNYYWAGGANSTFQGCDDVNAACSGHAWQVTGFTSSSPYSITINARTGDKFPVGQLIEVTCAQGTHPQMGTVTGTTGSAPGSMTLTLAAPATNNPYTTNIQGSSGSTFHDQCFDTTGVSLFLVNRYRYFILSLVPATPPGVPAQPAEPWLMLDRGIDYNGNGTTPENGDNSDLIPIAHGVEGFQVAYLLRPDPNGVSTAPDNNTNWVIGDSPGVIEEPDPFATGPLQNTPDIDPSRFTKNPANIRGVRIRLTVRSILKDLSQGKGFAGDPAVPAGQTSIENRNTFPTGAALGQVRRYFTSVTVATPNLNSKDPFIF